MALQRGGRGLRDEEGPLDGEGLVTQRCAPAFAVRVVEVVVRTDSVACWRGRDERGDGGRTTRGRGVTAGEARAREGEMCLVAAAIGRDGEAEGGIRLL